MRKILLVEDDSSITRLLELIFLDSYEIVSTAYGKDVSTFIGRYDPIVIILDIGLPDSNGMDLISRIRESTEIPIIMLSGRDHDLEKVTSFNYGADDFIAKPFSVAELRARVEVAIRHYNKSSLIHTPLPLEDNPFDKQVTDSVIRIELDEQRVFVNAQEIILTHKEFILMKLFCDMKNKVLTREYILDAVWGINNLDVDSRAVDVCVSRLRKKLRSSLDRDIIQSVPGTGYRMVNI